ncbi:type II toxin-antitoxin system Phd/YefM family antitoxin [Acidithiobacillus ferriphilus]|uniref:type II toxin-antitoxin system Phd/YefM family antitoxin n=1 Tax=Acidithiobacillus ferriphilus TaxID=1689834 RepID=UPI001C072F00|nr:type II toxin-antitoxin system prevent-host-death family antitoxin [Acidithiobacillus ferriphilus]MBU2845684.1 type II toxin-antitoxin system prevent-host-death family antitoxin [Acidithiobacillus ferriphilus]
MRFSEILHQVESGETVVITRHGRPVARVESASKVTGALPVDRLVAFRARMPHWRKRSIDLLQEMRDESI